MRLDHTNQTVQEVAEAVASVLSVDVTIVNSEKIRIAATGKYRDKIGSPISSGCFYDNIIKSENSDFYIQKKENEICKKCENFASCNEIATMGFPIKTGDGENLGVMGLVAFDEATNENIRNNYDKILFFLDKLASLIVGTVRYEQTIDDLNLKNQEITNLANSIDIGIMITDQNQKIKNCNFVTSSLLGLDRDSILGKGIKDIFEDINPDDSTSYSSLNNKLGKGQVGKKFVVKKIENEADSKTRSYTYEVSLYDDMIQNAYDLIEKKTSIDFDQILGNSKLLKETKDLARQVSLGDSSVMIRGESGTGKELFARAIHNNSSRKNKSFVAINCSSIPDNLLESELFGYEKGAFTGASSKGKIGKFELANGGTLFLDEIGDLPIHLQPKLLRVLQDGSFTRIGGTQKIEVDFRLISATNRNLEKMIENQEFREDLYYRINVIPIQIPALRYRKEDIEILAKNKLEVYCQKLYKPPMTLSPEVLQIFHDYDRKGNIRELENVIEYLVNISSSEVIGPDLLPKKFFQKESFTKGQEDFSFNIDENKSLKEMTKDFEKNLIENYLLTYGDSTKAKEMIAQKLGINLSSLYRKMY